MNTRSLKFRLVAWYAGWLTALFIVFGIFVYVSLDHYLEKSLREALARRARQVADMVQRSGLDWTRLETQIPRTFAPEVNNRFTRVLANGTIAYVSGPPADRSFDPQDVPIPLPIIVRESFGPRSLPDGTEMLIMIVSRATPEGSFVVEEGESSAPIQTTLHAWLAVLIVGLAVLICGAVMGGALLVRWALKPVDHIIRSAEQISSRNLNERLPVPETGDEIQRLSSSINSMIRRLDEGFQQTQRFFADASHELRTPLTIIQGELESVTKNKEAKADVRETAASALEEVDRLKNIVDGLFALSRLESGEVQENFESVDLAELAATTADQMCLLAEDKNISIACHCDSKVHVLGDRARMKQVVVNLLDNAIKYTPAGGHVKVTVAQRNGYGVLQVADDGIGIPAEALPRLYERFFRVDKARSREMGGAGLGLSIVKSICTAHHGQVHVQSKEGAGSRFTVELPLSRDSIS